MDKRKSLKFQRTPAEHSS